MNSKAQKSARQVSLQEESADAQRLKAEKERRWRAEHAEAIRAENDYIEKHGLPLAGYRLF
ncbi:type II toxin-antitoxin system CcdA family antitoxin [Rhizobium sp. LjRoot254]|uniref:type II toxin-antitoxin system CcdA family antitoxin n=1 Tax=Rhizobium sp. LjRoot254 TaxID=3342297 RepID=UPI003ECFB36B